MTLPDLDACAQRAHDLIQYADGLEEGGHEGAVCGRIRMTARDVLELVEQLASARSSVTVLRAKYNECLNIIGKAAYQAAAEEGTRHD